MSQDESSQRPFSSTAKTSSPYASPAPSAIIYTPRETSVMPNSGAEDQIPVPGGKTISKKRPAPKSSTKRPPKKPQKKKRKVDTVSGDEAEFTRFGSKALDEDSDEEEDDRNEVYCICRMPDSGKWMIGCDSCDDWFHGQCVNVAEADGDLVDKYYCPRCNETGLGVTTWKRKCRLPKCRRAALVKQRPPSKYCSRQHGIEFFAMKCDVVEVPLEDLNAIVSSVSFASDFQQLGSRVPTPLIDDYYDDGVDSELQSIIAERQKLKQKQQSLSLRSKYVALSRDRQKRLVEEIKSEPEWTPKTSKDLCGFDSRLSEEDDEFYAWCASDQGVEVYKEGKIDGRENTCMKKKCERHRGWLRVALEDVELEEKLITESLSKLMLDEAKLRERQKERTLEHVDKVSGQVAAIAVE